MQAINHDTNRGAPPAARDFARAVRSPRAPASLKVWRQADPLEPSDPCFGCVDWFMYDRTQSKVERPAEVREQVQRGRQRT
jgi:hypothetical protein